MVPKVRPSDLVGSDLCFKDAKCDGLLWALLSGGYLHVHRLAVLKPAAPCDSLLVAASCFSSRGVFSLVLQHLRIGRTQGHNLNSGFIFFI